MIAIPARVHSRWSFHHRVESVNAMSQRTLSQLIHLTVQNATKHVVAALDQPQLSAMHAGITHCCQEAYAHAQSGPTPILMLESVVIAMRPAAPVRLQPK